MLKLAGTATGLILASGIAMAAHGAPPRQAGTHVKAAPDTVRVKGSTASDDDLQPMMRRLRVLAGHGAELGVTVQDPDATGATGAVVQDVREGSPAAKAGIRKGDIITEFDGERVRSARELSRLVAETAEGRTVKAGLLREGKRVDVSVTPESGENAGREFEHEFVMPGAGERFEPGMPGPDTRRFFFDMRRHGEGPDWFSDEPRRARLGVGIQDLTPQLAEYFGAKAGVLVTSVEPGTPAAQAGLKAGDVITTVNGRTVEEGRGLVEAVQGADEGGELTIGYLRDRTPGTTKATLPAPERKKVERPAEPI